MSDRIEKSFPEFYRNWVAQLKTYLQLLSTASKNATTINEQDQKNLISTLTTHFKDYYTTKWVAAHEDVSQFFSATWLKPWERFDLWITGWKPSLMFKLIEALEKHNPNMRQLSELQVNKIAELRTIIKMDEKKAEEEMKRVQMTAVDPERLALLKWAAEVRNNPDSHSPLEARQVDEAEEVLLKRYCERLFKVVKRADFIRLQFLRRVLFEILDPSQCIVFLVGMSMFEIKKLE